MRSVFAKLLLWLIAAVVITSVTWILAAALTIAAPRERNMPFQMLTDFQMRELITAYESSGTAGLDATMRELFSTGDMDAILTDARGVDVRTGKDRSALIRAAERARFLPLRVGRWIALDRQSEDGKYHFFLLLPRGQANKWILRPAFLWIFLVAVVLAYLLARHLTAPLLRLQEALERFGTSDLSARTRSKRADEIGGLARSFDQMADRIQTLLTAERRLLQDISHELRSPLARLSVAVELARSRDHRETALNQIQKESDRMNALIAELLQVTRAEGDPASLELEVSDLEELVGAIVADANIEADARGCAVEFHSPGPLKLPVDEELFRRAIENVIRNGVRYAPPGTAVEVSLSPVGDGARITVHDYGPGVPEEAVPHLFDAFYRVESDRNRNTGGAGLGLSIARRAVELHRGKINARNTGPGLLVTITIPGVRS